MSDGAQFLQTLADSECSQLTSITISKEANWFRGTDECMGSLDSLVTLIARQSELESLVLPGNDFTEEQEQRVRSAIANNGCRVKFIEEKSRRRGQPE